MSIKSQTQSERIWFIDFFRTLAILGMIAYHLIFDLYYFGQTGLDPFSIPLIILARSVAIIFLFLVGYSFFVSSTRHKGIISLFSHSAKRAFILFLFASLVSLATFIVNPSFTVRFGILHLISVSIILLVPVSLLKVGYALALLVVLIVISSAKTAVSAPSFDYFPFIPWFSVVLIGYLTAKLLPPSAKHSNYPLHQSITWISKNSLLLYLIHQPIILLALLLLKG